jgi:hypothetical protein
MDQQAGQPGAMFWLIWGCVMVFFIASMWKVFTKAGKPGWASIVPIYNLVVILQIAEKPIWWILLLLIPIVNIVVAVMVYISFAKAFGKGTGFGLGLAFLSLIFLPILAWGGAEYQGGGSGATPRMPQMA